jgi:hypothetical protein
MGASFRSVGEVLALCGCDRLTISPALLIEMDKMTDEVPLKMSVEEAMKMDIPKVVVDEKKFRWEMNQDAMANEKLAEGIRKFAVRVCLRVCVCVYMCVYPHTMCVYVCVYTHACSIYILRASESLRCVCVYVRVCVYIYIVYTHM